MYEILQQNQATLHRHMHLGLDCELLCYKQEERQAAPQMRYLATVYSDPLHLLSKA